jgi:5-methylcytosine-specific restriction enzyme A
VSGKWSGSTRRSRLPADWPKIRSRVLKLDGYRCTRVVNGVRCTERATDVDHIVNNDNHDETNLTSLCAPHHREKSTVEGNRARAAIRAEAKHPAESHPGIL